MFPTCVYLFSKGVGNVFLNAFYMLPNLFPQLVLNVFKCFQKTTWYNFGTHVAAAKNRRAATVSVLTLPRQKTSVPLQFRYSRCRCKKQASIRFRTPKLLCLALKINQVLRLVNLKPFFPTLSCPHCPP